MAKERVQSYRNTGTAEAPVWDKYYPKTTADAVMMSDADGESISVEDEVKVTWDTPATANVGGIEKGATYTDASIKDIVYDITHPYVAPTVTAVMTPKNGGTVENGSTQNVTEVTATIKKGSHAVTGVTFAYDGGGEDYVIPASDSINTSGSGTSTITLELNITKATAKKNITVNVTDASGKSVSANTGTFAFVYPYYSGTVSSAAPTAAQITACTKIVEPKGSKLRTFTCSNQRPMFASPSSFGKITKITDQNGFDMTSAFAESTVNITGLDGTSQSYYVYTQTNAATLSSFKMTFAH